MNEKQKRKFERLLADYTISWCTGTHTNFDNHGKSQVDKLENFISANFIDKQILRKKLGEILDNYSDWLHKKGYIDADYYSEEPKAVDVYLNQGLQDIKKLLYIKGL